MGYNVIKITIITNILLYFYIFSIIFPKYYIGF